MSDIAWVVMNRANLYYGRGGFCIQNMLNARLFTPEEACQMLRTFPDAVAIRVEVEECDLTQDVDAESVVA